MLDERDLQFLLEMEQRISSHTTTQMAEMEQRITDRTAAQFAEAEQRTAAQFAEAEKRTAAQFAESEQRSADRMRVLLESYVEPKLQLLAEGQQSILEKMPQKSRVEALEDEVAFLKQMMKTLASEVNGLKKAE